MVPINNIHYIYLTWTVPPLLGLYKQQPDQYLAHLFRHKGQGSISSLLKSKGWAISIHTGIDTTNGFEFSTSHELFTISCELTLSDLNHCNDVTAIVFQYILLLQLSEYPDWVFYELKAISEMNFRFMNKESPIEYVEEPAAVMEDRYNIERQDLLRHCVITGIHRKNSVARLCDQLCPNKVRIQLLLQSFDQIYWQHETWFQTPYNIHSIDTTQWDNRFAPTSKVPTSQLIHSHRLFLTHYTLFLS